MSSNCQLYQFRWFRMKFFSLFLRFRSNCLLSPYTDIISYDNVYLGLFVCVLGLRIRNSFSEGNIYRLVCSHVLILKFANYHLYKKKKNCAISLPAVHVLWLLFEKEALPWLNIILQLPLYLYFVSNRFFFSRAQNIFHLAKVTNILLQMCIMLSVQATATKFYDIWALNFKNKIATTNMRKGQKNGDDH